jgi:hypothetical protein
MPVLTISSFASLAGLLLAARKLATDPDPLNRMKALADLAKDGRALAAALRDSGLRPLAAEMERRARDADAAFAHDGPAKEDARAVFWQVAPEALGDGAVLAGAGLEAGAATEAMVAAIRGSAAGRDFARTVLAEAYFRAVAGPVLEVMLDRAEFVAGIAPDLWRESLRRQGVTIEVLARVEATGLRTEAKLDAQTELLRRMQEQLATMASAQAARASGVTDSGADRAGAADRGGCGRCGDGVPGTGERGRDRDPGAGGGAGGLEPRAISSTRCCGGWRSGRRWASTRRRSPRSRRRWRRRRRRAGRGRSGCSTPRWNRTCCAATRRRRRGGSCARRNWSCRRADGCSMRCGGFGTNGTAGATGGSTSIWRWRLRSPGRSMLRRRIPTRVERR